MKGLIFHGKEDLRYQDIEDPSIIDDRDVVIKAKVCGICGSDLHIYHDKFTDIGDGYTLGKEFCVGHEAVGEVVEKGAGVKNLKIGDTVILSAMTGCGHCRPCLRGQSKLCEEGWNVFGHGLGLGGCQAEYIRVPSADFNTTVLPEGLTMEQGILLTDNLPTAYFAAMNANVGPGRSVAIVGLGPIGLMAVELALLMGASIVYGIDLVKERREMAEKLGAVSLEGSDIVTEVRELTHGRMIDCVIEAVGSDATMSLALSLVGINGHVSALGVNNSMQFTIPRQAFINNVSVRGNFVTEVAKCWPDLVPLLQSGRLRSERFITNKFSLSNGSEAYKLFDKREGGILKAVLYPD